MKSALLAVTVFIAVSISAVCPARAGKPSLTPAEEALVQKLAGTYWSHSNAAHVGDDAEWIRLNADGTVTLGSRPGLHPWRPIDDSTIEYQTKEGSKSFHHLHFNADLTEATEVSKAAPKEAGYGTIYHKLAEASPAKPANESQPAPPMPAVVTFADFDKAMQAVHEAARAVFSAIEVETAAGRLNAKEADAESDRARDLRHAIAYKRLDRWVSEKHLQSILKNPPRNAAILQAWNDLDGRLKAYDTLYSQKYPGMIADAVEAAAKLWKEARKSDELNPTIENLKGMEALRSPSAGEAPALTALIHYLGFYIALLDAENTGDPQMIDQAASRLSVQESPFGALVSVDEVNERVYRGLDEVKQAVWKEMLDTLARAARPDDVNQIAHKLSKVALATVAPARRKSAQDYSRFYKATQMAIGWREMLLHETEEEWTEAAGKAVEISHHAEKLAPSLVAPLQAHIARAQQQAIQSGKKQHEALVRTIGEELEAVSGLSDLRAVINDPAVASDQAGSGDTRDLKALRGHLRWLSSVWAMIETGMTPSPALLSGGAAFRHPWAAQTGGIWDKIQRQFIARELNRPDVLQAPLNATPVKDLGKRLVNAAEVAHDWRKAFVLLRRLNSLDPAIANGAEPSPDGAGNEYLEAVRSLIAGGNFEKAEMWPDAIRSYKAALSFLGDPLVSAEGADRLKSLKKQHAELF